MSLLKKLGLIQNSPESGENFATFMVSHGEGGQLGLIGQLINWLGLLMN